MNFLKAGLKPAVTLALGLGAVGFSLPGMAAHVTIDSFITDHAPITVTTGTGPQTASSSVAGAGMVGGYRDIIVIADPDSPGASATAQVSGGISRFANDSQSSSTMVIQWDGNDNDPGLDLTGLGGVDLTAAGRNAVEFEIAFDDRPATLDFSVYSLDGAVSQVSLNTAGWIETATTMTIKFSDFTGFADFTNVGAIELTISSSLNALDFEIGNIETVTVVPVPAAIWFMGSALAGLGLFRRRRV